MSRDKKSVLALGPLSPGGEGQHWIEPKHDFPAPRVIVNATSTGRAELEHQTRRRDAQAIPLARARLLKDPPAMQRASVSTTPCSTALGAPPVNCRRWRALGRSHEFRRARRRAPTRFERAA